MQLVNEGIRDENSLLCFRRVTKKRTFELIVFYPLKNMNLKSYMLSMENPY